MTDSQKPTDWYASTVETKAEPMIDPGKGQELVLRQFEFYFDPKALNAIGEKRIPAPTKQELFNSNWPQMRIMLWSDGLIANQDVEPRIIIGRKRYKIFILCQPRVKASGVKEMVVDKAKNLSEILNPSA